MPLVSVVLAAHDAEAYLAGAVRTVLDQTVEDLELIVVDDASSDGSPELLERVDDRRLVVIRNEERLGLAGALNRGLERARGRYVARMDADDLAFPRWLERELALIRSGSLGIVGSAVLDIDGAGRPRALRELPADPLSVRWHALFSSPFYHNTVLLDRELLERHGLAYDPAYEETEDYDLWSRLLAHTDGANLREALVLYRLHPGQASRRRHELQRRFQLEIALRQIAEVAPGLSPEEAELAWSIGAGREVPRTRLHEARQAFLDLLEAFRRRHGSGASRRVGHAAAAALARAGLAVPLSARGRVLASALALRPALPLEVGAARLHRRRRARMAVTEAKAVLAEPPVRVVVVAPEPTPYGASVYDRLARLPDLDLTVVYSGRTLMWRSWTVELGHPAVFLRGLRIPGARRLVHHELPVTPGIFRALSRARPDVVVVVGWSTFAAQGAAAWCRARRVPYVLVVDSHDQDPRPGWRRAVKEAVVPRVVCGAASLLVTGTLVCRSMLARGVPTERIRTFPVTIDVDALSARAEELAAHRQRLRSGLGLAPGDVVVLSVARLSPEKGLDTLIRAVAAAGDPTLVLVLVGGGPDRLPLEGLARSVGVRALFAGERPWERMVESYVAADVFALLSEREPWGVVVNEAAACRLPLVLSRRVGAAADLLRDGENGTLVAPGDVRAAAEALRTLAQDRRLRRLQGGRSRELVAGWGYEAGIESFVEAVREAAAAR